MTATTEPIVIAIDGPSGSGKGTVAMTLANKLGWHYLDSGALYRILAYLADQKRIDLSDVPALVDLAKHLNVTFSAGQIRLNGQLVSDEIRTETIGALASMIAPIVEVREALYLWQRQQILAPGLIADGRDMGSVVFPDSVCKLFITASIETRAERRYRQLINKGFDVSIPQLSQEIAARDERDMSRTVSPLKAAEDAIIIDTTSMTIQQVDDYVFTIVQSLL